MKIYFYRKHKQNILIIFIRFSLHFTPNYSKNELGIDFLNLDGYNRYAIKREIAEYLTLRKYIV